MGIEWNIRLKNKMISEIYPLIQNCLIAEGVENFNIHSSRILVPSAHDNWNDMEFIFYDDHIYCIHHGGVTNGQHIMMKIEKMLKEAKFDFSVEEL